MIRWPLAVVAIVMLAAPDPAPAQSPSTASSYPANPGGAAVPNPADADAPNPADPYAAKPTRDYGANPANYGTASYGSNPANYVAMPESAKHKETVRQQAAEQQSGLSAAQAQTLLEEKGYHRIVSVQADPGSLWVWQADVMKDGRPTRVGIDYRGNVLELSSTQARPCTVPGVQLGAVGGLGVGSRLSQSDACASR
ncbi:MAG TPA: hypothetical protein VMF86_05845 [Stellaceae bacterium]|nr:hypothetical protein [Stellaceae bacterium]